MHNTGKDDDRRSPVINAE